MKKHKTSRRRKMLKRRIISLTIFGVIIGLFLYTPIKIKHFSLLHSEAEASERFSLQMEAINDYKSIKESFNNIYTTDEKINEINKFIENIEKNLSEGITEELESLISNLKSKINELSASNQIELENMFNDINEDNLKGFSEEEMNKVNELTDEYNQLFSEKKYKQAKETLNSLINYINVSVGSCP